ncbi:MAG: hypothetical protein V3U24_03075 [Candidatus Neomarinimicrobiota bacterium]
MVRTFWLIFLLSPSLWVVGQSSSEILAELYRESGWTEVAFTHGDMRVFNKEVENFGIPAIMVKKTAPVSSGAMASAIEDVANYTRFLEDVYLERSDLLKRDPKVIEGYHLLDLPLISDRHYVYRMSRKGDSSDGSIRYEWTLVPRNSENRSFLDSMDAVHGTPVYVGENVGGWEIQRLPEGGIEVSYRLLIDPAGRVPDFLMARANRVTAPRMVRGMIEEAIRREKK